MNRVILLRYGELHLKGRNRPFFEKALLKAIGKAVAGFDGVEVVKGEGRIYIEKPCDIDALTVRLARVFGLVSLSHAWRVEKDIDIIKNATTDIMSRVLEEKNAAFITFKVQAQRSDKKFCLDSPALNVEIGAYLLEKFPKLKVDVHKPDITIYLEIREHAYIYHSMIPAVGGMPSGTNGKAVLLLSGGIDSPVAGFMVAKRGVEPVAVHFHSFPFTGERSKQKVIDLCRIIARYCDSIKLYVVPFTEIQQEIYNKCPQSYLTVLMRRYMMKIAQSIAVMEQAQALVTGESIGQVASQTMDALAVTDDAVSMPVFRPLIGMDKVEIMDRAKNIGTYETSILPFEDCCTVFVPKHPAIHPHIDRAREAERLMDEDKLIAAALAGMEISVERAGV